MASRMPNTHDVATVDTQIKSGIFLVRFNHFRGVAAASYFLSRRSKQFVINEPETPCPWMSRYTFSNAPRIG